MFDIYLTIFIQSSAPGKEDCHILQAAMQRMLNAYLSMLSILMSVDEAIYKKYSMIENSVKLFMTASHYCDLEFRPNETDTTTKKKIKAVDLLSLDEIHTVLSR